MPGLAAESDFKPLSVGRAFSFSALLGLVMGDPLNSKGRQHWGKKPIAQKSCGSGKLREVDQYPHKPAILNQTNLE